MSFPVKTVKIWASFVSTLAYRINLIRSFFPPTLTGHSQSISTPWMMSLVYNELMEEVKFSKLSFCKEVKLKYYSSKPIRVHLVKNYLNNERAECFSVQGFTSKWGNNLYGRILSSKSFKIVDNICKIKLTGIILFSMIISRTQIIMTKFVAKLWEIWDDGRQCSFTNKRLRETELLIDNNWPLNLYI